MAKQFGYNLLTFVYFPIQHRGTAKLVLKKKTCKTIIKIYNKNKKSQTSDKVKTISNFLNSNAVAKISVVADDLTIPINLTEEIAFVIIEQWSRFVQWRKNINNGLIIVTTKNLKVENDWVGSDPTFISLDTQYAINNREIGMNTIVFNNGLSYEQYGIKYNSKGVTKIILTPKLWKEMVKLSDNSQISQYLSNEQIFCFLALEPNSNKILNYAFDQLAIIIFNNKTFINDAFLRFKNGVVLEFEAEIHEQFQLKQISSMQINSIDSIK